MPDVEDTRVSTQPDKALSRREFMLNVGVVGGLTVAAAGSAIYGLRFVLPAISPLTFVRVLVTNVDALPDGQAVSKTLLGTSFTLVNRGGLIRAFSSVCTHLGCKVEWRQEDLQFFCPCHLGFFDANGDVVSGPPPRSLDEYDIQLDGSNIYVMLPETTRGGAG